MDQLQQRASADALFRGASQLLLLKLALVPLIPERQILMNAAVMSLRTNDMMGALPGFPLFHASPYYSAQGISQYRTCAWVALKAVYAF
jgi:hypothetical protein